MSFDIIETYSEGDYREVEIWKCRDCGRTVHIESGGDVACCVCEFENEGRDQDE